MNPFADLTLAGVISTIVYSLLGLAIFALAYFVIERITPFSVRKEIEEDQNTSLGIIVGAFILGLAIIIAAAIHSPSPTPPVKIQTPRAVQPAE